MEMTCRLFSRFNSVPSPLSSPLLSPALTPGSPPSPLHTNFTLDGCDGFIGGTSAANTMQPYRQPPRHEKKDLSFSEIAARAHCRSCGVKVRHRKFSWKRTLLPAFFKPSWNEERKHPSVRIRDMGTAACVTPEYTRGTYMTVFDSMRLDVRNPSVEYVLRLRLSADTSRAGITVGVVDPDAIDPTEASGCELCQTERGWGVFVCKGLRDKFTNGLYNGGKYLCGRESKDIRYGWSKNDVIEIRIRRGEIVFCRNEEVIPEVCIRNPTIVGTFVFAVTLYNSRLEIRSLQRIRKLSHFEDPRLECCSDLSTSPAASKGTN